ncbi:unnamed protein product, partial [Darwinula stevensoni]
MVRLSSNSISDLGIATNLEALMSTLEEMISAKTQELADGMEKLRHENEELKLKLKHETEKLKFQQTEQAADMQRRENTVEERLLYLEARSFESVTCNDLTWPAAAPPSCQTLADLGVTHTGTYLVDPDGVFIGDPPIQVLCDMETDPVSTVVLHDSMGNTEIDHCADPGCYRRVVGYEATMKQMVALIDQSESCQQQIRLRLSLDYSPLQYDCFATALSSGDTHYAWWLDRHDDAQYYWDGANAGEHVCNCGLSDDCVDSAMPCNCDAEAPQWESDSGAITNGTALPITELRFGGLQFDGQMANYTLGGLTCKGKAPPPGNPAESCSTLRQAGNTGTGYHLITNKEGRFDVVLCRMDLEETDSEFQIMTSARIAEEVVYFDTIGASGSVDSIDENGFMMDQRLQLMPSNNTPLIPFESLSDVAVRSDLAPGVPHGFHIWGGGYPINGLTWQTETLKTQASKEDCSQMSLNE